jgi:hypothetical protein
MIKNLFYILSIISFVGCSPINMYSNTEFTIKNMDDKSYLDLKKELFHYSSSFSYECENNSEGWHINNYPIKFSCHSKSYKTDPIATIRSYRKNNDVIITIGDSKVGLITSSEYRTESHILIENKIFEFLRKYKQDFTIEATFSHGPDWKEVKLNFP